MKLQKSHLELFYLTLKETRLSLQDSRIRDVFIKTLGEAVDLFYSQRKQIYEKFCDKNEDGTPDIKEDKYTFKKEVTDELNNELKKLIEEEVELPYEWGVGPSKLKEIIEKTEYKPKIFEVKAIDEIIEKIV